ncbi:MAG: UDP-2,3-diacylglucosamine diphosphatase, partial [Chromatiales bacterium]
MHRYRTVWISDTHLGLKEARTDFLYDFLSTIECDTLYLVGDIIDGWKMNSGGFRWPEINNDIIKLVLSKARNGTTVIYVPGNHDEMFRDYADAEVNNIQLRERATHTTADGRKLLVMHGDEFDYVVM